MVKHPMQCYMLKRGDKYTITVYYDEGGYYQYECPAPKLKNEKDWTKFRSEVEAKGSANYDKRVPPMRYAVAVKKSKKTKPAEVPKHHKLSSKKPVPKYTAENNPLLRRR